MAVSTIRRPVRSAPVLDIEEASAFKFERAERRKFSDVSAYRGFLAEQAESVEVVPADILSGGISMEGEVEGTDYKLMESAFADLCHNAQAPAAYLRRLSVDNPSMAEDLVNFHTRQIALRDDRKLVVDSRTNRIHAIVSDRYAPLPNATVFSHAESTQEDGHHFEVAEVLGLFTRFRLVSEQGIIEPRKGDIIKTGISVDTGMGGDSAVNVDSFNLRLVCTNGMLGQGDAMSFSVRHEGDALSERVAKAAILGTRGTRQFAEFLNKSFSTRLDVSSYEELTQVLASPKVGGSERFLAGVLLEAGNEAMDEGREQSELTLYNVVNGVTAQARTARTLDRQRDIERMGFALLKRYAYLFN